jgi:DNA-binding MarR family transcriptional regulator
MDLARAFQVPKTSMSHTLAGLEKRGLIRMEPNPDDGRGKLVRLTDSGQVVRNRAIQDIAPDIANIIPQFGLEDAQVALPFLRKLRAVLDKARDK